MIAVFREGSLKPMSSMIDYRASKSSYFQIINYIDTLFYYILTCFYNTVVIKSLTKIYVEKVALILIKISYKFFILRLIKTNLVKWVLIQYLKAVNLNNSFH